MTQQRLGKIRCQRARILLTPRPGRQRAGTVHVGDDEDALDSPVRRTTAARVSCSCGGCGAAQPAPAESPQSPCGACNHPACRRAPARGAGACALGPRRALRESRDPAPAPALQRERARGKGRSRGRAREAASPPSTLRGGAGGRGPRAREPPGCGGRAACGAAAAAAAAPGPRRRVRSDPGAEGGRAACLTSARPPPPHAPRPRPLGSEAPGSGLRRSPGLPPRAAAHSLGSG